MLLPSWCHHAVRALCIMCPYINKHPTNSDCEDLRVIDFIPLGTFTSINVILDDVNFAGCSQGPGRSQRSCPLLIYYSGDPNGRFEIDFTFAIFHINRCHFWGENRVFWGSNPHFRPKQDIWSTSGGVPKHPCSQTFCPLSHQ